MHQSSLEADKCHPHLEADKCRLATGCCGARRHEEAAIKVRAKGGQRYNDRDERLDVKVCAVALALAREVATHEALTHNTARGAARVSVALVNKREDAVVDNRGRQRRQGSPGAAARGKDAAIAVRLTTNACQGRRRPARLEIKLVRCQPVDSVRISCMGCAVRGRLTGSPSCC